MRKASLARLLATRSGVRTDPTESATHDGTARHEAATANRPAVRGNIATAVHHDPQAGLNWLSAEPPDLEEVRQALISIASAGNRAAEIVVRLRALMTAPQPRAGAVSIQIPASRAPRIASQVLTRKQARAA
jgi:hypothetical protein